MIGAVVKNVKLEKEVLYLIKVNTLQNGIIVRNVKMYNLKRKTEDLPSRVILSLTSISSEVL